MKLRIFGINERSTLEPLPTAELTPTWMKDETHRWIDIEAATPDELQEVLAPLELPNLILESCLQNERSSRFISRRDALYLEVPTYLGWNESWKPYISVLCLPTTIITIHHDPLHTIEDVIDGLDQDVPLFARDASALLYHLFVEISKKNLDAALDVRSEAEALSHALNQDPDRIDPQQIAALRRQISHYSTVQDDHTYCAGVLRTVESKRLHYNENSSYFSDLLQLATVSRQLIAGAQSRVEDLENMYDAAIQTRVESRLRMLTILSAVFLPLTLISGIYGMNFSDLPGMGVGYGYFIVIGIMLATVGFMGWFMYRRGWFQ